MRFVNKAVVAAGLGFTVSAVVGCGSSGDLLSSAQANQMRSDLNHATAALNASNCGLASGYISDFQDQVDELGSVNQTLVSNLQAGASKIEMLAKNECPTSTTPAPTRTTTHPRTTPTKTTPTTTTVTQTVTSTSSTSSTDTNTDTSTGQTTTGTGTSSTDTSTQPGNALTGVTTSSTPTSPTPPVTPTTPTSGGSGLNGGGTP